MTRKQGTTPAATPLPLRARIGQNIRAARDAAGLTQGELALALKLRESQTVSNWERGVSRPSDENLVALGRVLGHDESWFYAEHDESEPKAAA